jgi:hypothetical protein
MARHRLAQATEVVAGGGDVGTGAGADLDLALQVFRADLILELCRAGREQRLRRLGQRQRVAVDEQVFLFDAKAEGRCVHRLLPRSRTEQSRARGSGQGLRSDRGDEDGAEAGEVALRKTVGADRPDVRKERIGRLPEMETCR